MKFEKLGRVLVPNPALWWSQSYCMLPTPDVDPPDGPIRVYFASTDADNFGRIGFVDLDPADPLRLVGRSPEPILDLGRPGTFDDCGVTPSCVLNEAEGKRLYYIGFQRTFRVPVLLFPGIADSQDGGRTFEKRFETPILERSPTEPFTRTAPFVMKDGPIYRMWYVSGEGWSTTVSGKVYSRYAIRHCTSEDGVRWPPSGAPCLVPDEALGEEGFARPWVLKEGGRYRMWYAVRRVLPNGAIGYDRIACAESDDGVTWSRGDAGGLERSESGWDSEMICYGAVVPVRGELYMFYCGNGNGKTGFGCARLAR